MDPVQAPGVYQGAANVIAAVMLLLEFGMLRQALIRDQIRLYAAQSALISVLAIVIAADRGLPDGSPTTSTWPRSWRTRPGWPWPPPGSPCTRNGYCG